MTDVVILYTALLGFGALVSLLVSIGKLVGIVKDGTADKWVAGLNLIGIVAVFILQTWFPTVNISGLDQTLVTIVGVLNVVLSYVTTLLGSKLAYFAVRDLPIIGKSYTTSERVD